MAEAIEKASAPGLAPDQAATAEELYRVGLLYSSGLGGEADYILAHKYFNLAALRGYEHAKQLRRELAEYMSSEEIAEAQKAAREWLKLAN